MKKRIISASMSYWTVLKGKISPKHFNFVFVFVCFSAYLREIFLREKVLLDSWQQQGKIKLWGNNLSKKQLCCVSCANYCWGPKMSMTR